MIKQLVEVSVGILNQVSRLTDQIHDEDYSKPLELLSSNTLAKHIRHVLEIYDEFLQGTQCGVIDYDARKRNLLIEHNRQYTMQFINGLTERLRMLHADVPVILAVNYQTGEQLIQVNTSVGRELSYNIEHAIHHMAILQISVKHLFPYIVLEEHFGVAFSTQNYLKQHVHAHLRTR